MAEQNEAPAPEQAPGGGAEDIKETAKRWAGWMAQNIQANDARRDEIDEADFQRSLAGGAEGAAEEPPGSNGAPPAAGKLRPPQVKESPFKRRLL